MPQSAHTAISRDSGLLISLGECILLKVFQLVFVSAFRLYIAAEPDFIYQFEFSL